MKEHSHEGFTQHTLRCGFSVVFHIHAQIRFTSRTRYSLHWGNPLEDISLSIVGYPHFNSKQQIILAALNLQNKAKNTILQAPEATIPQESSKHHKKCWRDHIQHPAHRKKKSLKEARRFWSSCQHRSLLIWGCAATWGHEQSGRNQIQLQK